MKRLLLVLLLFNGTARGDLSLDMRQWLPAKWQSAAVDVTVTPWMPFDGYPGIHFLGWNDVAHNRIYLRTGYEDSTFSHEAGHAIWHHCLTRAQKRQWRAIHWSHPFLKAAFVYPRDPAHSFAEAFSDFVSQPRVMLRDDPDVFNWFRVTSGTDYLERKDPP